MQFWLSPKSADESVPPAVREGTLFVPRAAQAGRKAVGGGGSVFPSPRGAEAGLGFSRAKRAA